MLFYSTNRKLSNGFQEKVSFKTALFMGQTPDEGLFMPDFIPQFSENQLLALKDEPYHEVAFEVLKLFLQADVPDETLKNLTQEAYTFDIPIDTIEVKEKTLFIARMDDGPTASFKDFAAQLMARLMRTLKPPTEKITILVATSGDTGSAIGEAFHGLEGIEVVILYPKNEVSNIQRKQLTTLGNNVSALEIDGKFDDCQHFVKKAFTDTDLKHLHLTSANSINIGRLLPQVVYYFYIYLKVAENLEKVNFCIPTGNLGNAMGCMIAKQMGLPVNKIIVATNSNNAIPTWLQSGAYQKVSPSRNAISNAMNVGNPSNLARLFDLFDGTVDKNGTTHLSPDLEKIQESVISVSVTDEETIACVKSVYKKYHILLEPHGAVGMVALEKYPKLNYKTILLETAHPAKFPEVIEKELGFSPEVPQHLKDIMHKSEQKTEIQADYQQFKDFLLKTYPA
ncbi:MAG: threonine synthase [Verrucomicrobia bacterium]|nr:threonine synthase [Cytophagales bacterium]